MRKLFAVVLALAGAVCFASQKSTESDSLFSEVPGVCHDLETITGLKFHKTVPSAVLDRDQLRAFLSKRVDKVMKPEDEREESDILKMLGLVPADYDLRKETVDLLTEQAAAFYDYQRKKLFIMKGDTGESALMALSHELGHALADQNFHLEKYIKENSEGDDAATARQAVMEGQASWLMAAYVHQRSGLGTDVPEATITVVANSLDEGATDFPVYKQSPLYIRESLVFPYKAGMLFQDAVYRKMGKASFAEVFKNPPVSTQQIMHPELYLAHTDPKMPGLPKLPEPKHYRKLADGTMGEFDIRVMLRQYGSDELADQLGPALAGSQFTLFEDKREKNPVLVWATEWSSAGKAQEFFAFYKKALRGKAKKLEPGRETGTVLEGRDEYGFYRIVLNEKSVQCMEGLKSLPKPE